MWYAIIKWVTIKKRVYYHCVCIVTKIFDIQCIVPCSLYSWVINLPLLWRSLHLGTWLDSILWLILYFMVPGQYLVKFIRFLLFSSDTRIIDRMFKENRFWGFDYYFFHLANINSLFNWSVIYRENTFLCKFT